MSRSKTIALIGAFDTKGEEYAFVRDRIKARGHEVLAVNTGVMGTTDRFPVAVEAEEVARAGGGDLAALREKKDRGEAMKVMSEGVAEVVAKLEDAGRIDAAFGMGGTGGSSVISAALRALPIGFPKVLVSTAAAGDVSPYVGTRDVTMIHSVVDVAGLNRILRPILARAAGAVCGMAESEPPAAGEEKPIIAASMFGNTTTCVDACREALVAQGYEVIVFHATGAGGRTMESLVDDGFVSAVLDMTTTEWADQICGGVFDAGPTRLEAPGRAGIPHLIVPGCIDMCNFGPRDTVPEKYQDRLFYEWNPSVTLMRTTVEENARMGEVFAGKANAARGPVAFLIPSKGFSLLDVDGEIFHDPATNQAFTAALKKNLNPDVLVEEMDVVINDPKLAERATGMMLELIAKGR